MHVSLAPPCSFVVLCGTCGRPDAWSEPVLWHLASSTTPGRIAKVAKEGTIRCRDGTSTPRNPLTVSAAAGLPSPHGLVNRHAASRRSRDARHVLPSAALQVFRQLAQIGPVMLPEEAALLDKARSLPFRTTECSGEPHPGLRSYPFLGQVCRRWNRVLSAPSAQEMLWREVTCCCACHSKVFCASVPGASDTLSAI